MFNRQGLAMQTAESLLAASISTHAACFVPRTVQRAASRLLATGLIASAALFGPAAQAHGDPVDASAASALSLSLPVAVVATVMVTAMSAGVLLSAAGELLCFVPNQIGASLLYNERVAY